jgi:predicted AAA+ superfamily ATPase
VSDVPGFNKLVQMLATQTANLLKTNELSKLIGVSRYNIEKYLYFLQQTYIVHLLRPYYVNIGKGLVKTPKLYFIDTGIRNVVFNQFQDLTTRADNGQLVENFVFSELAKQLDLNNLWFYRTTSGTEIDFLYGSVASVFPIEVKYSETKQQSIPRAFNTVFQALQVKKAFILTKNYQNRNNLLPAPVIFHPLIEIPFAELLE